MTKKEIEAALAAMQRISNDLEGHDEKGVIRRFVEAKPLMNGKAMLMLLASFISVSGIIGTFVIYELTQISSKIESVAAVSKEANERSIRNEERLNK